jgi:hypothetical protein
VFKKFLERGADPLTTLPSSKPLACGIINHGKTPWILDNSVGKLIFSKAPIDPVMPDGNTVLHELCMQCRGQRIGKEAIEYWMELLLKPGADPNYHNNSGHSPLFVLFSHEGNYTWIVPQIFPMLLKYGGNPTLLSGNGQCPLFEAAIQKQSIGSLKALAHAATKQYENRDLPLVTDGSSWVHRWEMTIQAKDWKDARDYFLNSKDLVPADIEETIRRSTLETLADKHVEMPRSMFEGNTGMKEKRRKYLVNILRDCREQGIETEKDHLDYLLELCE